MRAAPITALLATALSIASLSAQAADDPWHGKARALYAHAELEQGIPPVLYTAVAQVLAYVYRLKAALRGEGRMPEALVPPEVPPELDPLQRTQTVGGSA